MKYFVKTPWIVKKLWSSYTWDIKTNEKNIYLSFDDGPHPVVTPFVLDELERYNAKATFFCIGKNVEAFPEIYKRILNAGHKVGNHTQQHLNGWKTDNDIYLSDIAEASKHIISPLFRPPYGRIKLPQAKKLINFNIVMWDVLSGDFDETLSKEKCLQNVINNAKQGSIVVFHDSDKAFSKLKYVLPLTMKFFLKSGYSFRAM
ncbi:MAG: polysaccharide deacetylase family protein [Chitinophagaceae bacterium]